MEAKRKRKPLSDCMNIPHTHRVSSSNKNPILASAIKTLLTDLNGKSAINSNSKAGSIATATSVNNGEVASENPSSVATASKSVKSTLVSGTRSRLAVVEPCSVYGRRSTSAKRKSKGKEVFIPEVGSPAASIKTASAGHEVVEPCSVYGRKSASANGKRKCKEVTIPEAGCPAASFKSASAGVKNKEDGGTVQHKSYTTHRKKKRKDDEDSLQDYIEQQKAYFREVDDFELIEEEVDSDDELE